MTLAVGDHVHKLARQTKEDPVTKSKPHEDHKPVLAENESNVEFEVMAVGPDSLTPGVYNTVLKVVK